MNDLQIALNTPFGYAIVGVFGLIWGSFFNVCILRMPKDESVVKGRSHCPKCNDCFPWYLNIPVLSYLFLLGKCRKCKAHISIQYPLIELVSAVLFVWLFHTFGWSVRFLSYTVFCSALLVISVIDLYHQIIPDEISLPGIIVGFIFAVWVGDVVWWESLLGILLGGGSFLAIAVLYEKLAKREGLGGGDIKLLAMIGAWLGYQSILTVIVVSSGLGSVIGIACMALQKKDFKAAIPFGPFLAVGAIVYVFCGTYIQSLLFPNFN